MKKTKKRFLALLLTLTMVLSMGMQTFAVGTDSESDIQTQDIQSETETGTEDNTADVPDSSEGQNEVDQITDETSETATEETADEGTLSDDTEVSVQSNDTEPAVRSNVSDKPADGTTSGQPFAAGTAGSQNFRIPAMVTLDDGTIVAAADARWNTSADAGGLDTIVSRSSDNGANWNYTFANYLGDNGNTYDRDSATFIDPALATDGSTIYMLADLFPGGVALNSSNQQPEAAAAFDEQGRLKLAQSGSSDYSYYLGKFENERAQIFDADGNAVADYTVDEYFNLYQGDEKASNLFFSDAPYQVVKTSYLYLTKSTDKGATWSAPTLINVKADDEQFYGVGPGTGIVTSTGRIIFAAYSHNSGGIMGLSSTEYTSVIYSDDNGQTWHRSADMSNESSEATLVEADGRIYMFTRHGGYYVSEDYGTTWSDRMNVAGISYDTGCQINALTYSEKIDGKTAILLSAPSNDRTNGRIFVGLVQDDGSISWKYTYSVNNSKYQYSCMAELEDGAVALLYENASAAIAYTDIAITDIAPGAQIGTGTTAPEEPAKEPVYEDKDLSVGETSDPYTVDGLIGEEGSFETADGVVAYEIKHNTETISGGTEVNEVTTLNPGEYIIGDGTHWLTLNGNNLGSTTDPAEATVWTVEISNQENNFYSIQVDGQYLGREQHLFNEHELLVKEFDSNTEWRWNSESGFYYASQYLGRSYYLRYSNGWEVSTQNSQNGNPYTYTEIPDSEKNTTTITFTGKAEGDTTVVIDNYEFTIHVAEIPDGDFSNIGDLSFVSNTGDSTYSRGKTVSHLILTPDISYDLNLSGADGYNVTWSIQEGGENIASVSQNGTVTGRNPGETVVIAEITDEDGNIVGRHSATVTVLEIDPMATDRWGDNGERIVEIYVNEIQDSRLYYVQNDENEYKEVYADTVIYISTEAAWAMTFFGAPVDENYALTYMSAANNMDQTNWFAIQDYSDMTQTTFYQNRGSLNNENIYTNQEVLNMLRGAKELGADGGFWFTRGIDATNNCQAIINVISERLPSLEKSIKSVIHNGETVDYTEGMQIYPGDTLVYEITVHRYETEYGIVYSNAQLRELLSGARFSDGTTQKSITSDLGTSGDPAPARDFRYEARYTVQDSDLDSMITNRVSLSYGYRAAYSTGELTAEAEAVAEVSVLAFDPDDYIIDFGSPITVDFTDKTSYNFVSGSANFGTVQVNGMEVTYTPNAVLTEADTVRIVNTRGAVYTFTVYPATSVYYEEGFASYDGSWSGGSAAAGSQTVSVANDEAVDLYGYDDLYASANGNSNNTAAVSSTSGGTATFTFNGTGLDIYALTTRLSGSMSLWLYEGEGTDGTLLKLGYVDTSNTWLEENNGNYYNTPVFSYKDLTTGTYTVKIIVNSGTISLDGYRVYNTQGDAYESVYAADQEDQALTAEVRDITIAGSTYNLADIDDWYKYGSNIIDAVYDVANDGSGAVILGEGNEITADAGMINDGPKNEIYLESGQTIAMRLTASSYDKVAVGMRSLNGGAVRYQINDRPESTLSSTVDMYYEVQPNDGMIVIENTGSNVLALTKIKVTSPVYGASGVSLFTMDADTMAFALQCIADETDTVETADAALTLNVVDVNGNAVAETVLTANGTVGETHTFAAADIQAAAEGILPEGYELTGEAADVEVAYGESDTTELQADKAAEEEPAGDGDNEDDSFLSKLGNAIKNAIDTVTDFFKSLFRW